MLKEAGFTKQQLNKNQTLLMVVGSNDIKTVTLAFSYLPFLSSEQRQQCQSLVATYDEDFEALLAERNEILEHVGGTRDTERELLAWKISVANLSRRIRRQMFTKVLTDEQRQELRNASRQKQKS